MQINSGYSLGPETLLAKDAVIIECSFYMQGVNTLPDGCVWVHGGSAIEIRQITDYDSRLIIADITGHGDVKRPVRTCKSRCNF